ncbi:dipeptidase [Engelhardtia mirabilis]|uniref:Membrane dipeptidase (Peptidase family M19) n=1 Tax=Engelhardtia mirabilis TaxID=2528011 RepID=A0A518BFE9_9BACT|nr:Membrane dipeptidase (Peptidase family M19) [Planctomycetes bacterium Pla133]QDV00035.1 Membrane dipeptidase (Peptidase family M19) [Planctomycetes bacterium Pla86]
MTDVDPNLEARVAALLAQEPVFDAHMDALQRAVDLGHDLGAVTPGQFDLVRARAGGLGIVVMVCWVDPDYLPDGARARAEALLEAAHDLARRHPEQLRLVRAARDFEAARVGGRIAGIPGIEGGHAIEQDLGVLEAFWARGLRVLTLVWNNHLPWIRSCQPGAGPDVPAGLSAFGRSVVRRMNDLGMVVDLSHAGERSFYDALESTEHPVMASHSGCHALHDHPRNLNDDQLRALADNDGVVGIVFHPGFLDADARAEEQRVRQTEAYRGATGTNPTDTFLRQGEVMQRDARPLSIERLVDHVEHALEVAGPRHVGLGSDFDGIERGPAGLGDASGYPRLAAAMLARGFDVETVAAVMGGNMRRLFTRVLDSGSGV